jgi:hypothetical protein
VLKVGELTAYLGIDDDEFQRRLAQNQTRFSNFGGQIKSMARSAAMYAGVAAAAVGGFLMSTMDEASNLAETLGKSSIVFGEWAGTVERMGNKAAKTMGMSKRAAVEAAATYGNLFVGMKVGKKPAADMSMSLVQLAADMGAFNNVPIAEVLENIRSGLVGEAEPMRKYGVMISEARLQAKAMELGLWDGKGAIDAAAKSIASYNIMLEDSATAQGNFALTAGGAAQQKKTLAAMWEDAKAAFGEALLPTFQQLMAEVIENMPAIISSFQNLIMVVKVSGITLKTFFTSFGQFLADAAFRISNFPESLKDMLTGNWGFSAMGEVKFAALRSWADQAAAATAEAYIKRYKLDINAADLASYINAKLWGLDPSAAAAEAARKWTAAFRAILRSAIFGVSVSVTGVGGLFGTTAAGGVFSTPQARVIAEAGTEAVVPLDDPYRRDVVMHEAGLDRGQDLSPLLAAINHLGELIVGDTDRRVALTRQGALNYG